MTEAEIIAQELHRTFHVVVQARAGLTDIAPLVRKWVDLSVERRSIIVETVKTLLANGTIAVGPGRERDVIAKRTLNEVSNG